MGEKIDIYTLHHDGNHYRSLVAVNQEEYCRLSRLSDGRNLAKLWRPQRVRVLRELGKRELPPSDFPSLGMMIMAVFSQRARDSLEGLLAGCGEWLPLVCREGDYWAFSITRIIDCLDLDASSYSRFSDGGIMSIHRYVLNAPREGFPPTFRLPTAHSYNQFGTGVLRAAVEANRLVGFQFRPLPGVGDDEARVTAAGAAATGEPTGAQVQGERRLSPEESSAIQRSVAAAQRLLRTRPGDDVEEIQRRVLEWIDARRKKGFRSESEFIDRATELGVLWGETVRDACGWEWVMLRFEDGDDEDLAIASPDRAHFVLPIHYLADQLQGSGEAATTLLLFNVLRSGQAPEAAPGARLQLG